MLDIGISNVTINKSSIKVVLVALIIVLGNCVRTMAIPLDTTEEEKFQNLVKQLHGAEKDLEFLVSEVETKHPELREYKSRKKDVEEWYWGERMKKWGEMSEDLYGSNPDDKDMRFKIFRQAVAHATQIYQCEQIVSGIDEDLLKRHYLFEPRRKNIEKLMKIDATSPEEFWEKYRAVVKLRQPEAEIMAQKWRKKYEFITPRVWDQAYKDGAAEFDINLLQAAIYQLTPQAITDAEDDIKKIKRKLDRIWPQWNEVASELKSSVNQIAEEQILAMEHTDVTVETSTADGKETAETVEINPPLTTNKELPMRTLEDDIEISKKYNSKLLWILVLTIAPFFVIIVTIIKKSAKRKQ